MGQYGKPFEPIATREVAFGMTVGDVERVEIQAELERILANPLFKNSRRYPNLLRYVVERTLDGHSADLKERTLGIEVFGRAPDYDTNLDPIVRTTAAEIRKRLAQYYQEANRESELRIDLPLGSYAARFHEPSAKATAAPTQISPAELVLEPMALHPPAARRLSPRALRLAAFAGIGSLIIAAAWLRPWTQHTSLDRFWSAVLDSTHPVLLCVGQRPFVGFSTTEPQSSPALPSSGGGSQTTLFQLYYLGSQNVVLPDVATLGRLAGFLQAKGKEYHIRGESSTTFEDLRDGPVVLIGAFNNDWSMRLMGRRRFTFEREGDTFRIRDAQQPSDRSHSVNYAMPYLQLSEDYAVVSRVLDPVTERMVVMAAGLTGYGTAAAGEFLTNPAYMEAIASAAPRGWARKDVEVLISTKVINGKSGPPKVVAAHFW